MNRLAFLILLVLSSVSFAGTGDPVPLCPAGSPPDCVIPNWGQVQPDGVDSSISPTGGPSLAAVQDPHRLRMAVQMMPTAAPAEAMAPNTAAPIKSVVSPQNLFPKETAALITALKRARFNADGTIKSGEAAIRRAAAAAARRAGNKYNLRLYIKVPQGLKPEQGAQLDKKVDALNVVLGGAYGGGQTGTPKT